MYSVNSSRRSETINESFHVGMNCFVRDAVSARPSDYMYMYRSRHRITRVNSVQT